MGCPPSPQAPAPEKRREQKTPEIEAACTKLKQKKTQMKRSTTEMWWEAPSVDVRFSKVGQDSYLQNVFFTKCVAPGQRTTNFPNTSTNQILNPKIADVTTAPPFCISSADLQPPGLRRPVNTSTSSKVQGLLRPTRLTGCTAICLQDICSSACKASISSQLHPCTAILQDDDMSVHQGLKKCVSSTLTIMLGPHWLRCPSVAPLHCPVPTCKQYTRR